MLRKSFVSGLSVLLVVGCATPSATVTQTTPPALPTSTAPAGAPTATQAPASTLPAEYKVEVYVGDKKVADLRFSDMTALPQVALQDAPAEQGPTLKSVLDRLEVQDFTSVTVKGFARGRTAPAELSLTRAEVTDNLILGLTQQGTAKLAGAALPKDRWVIDVTRIDVQGSAAAGAPIGSIEVFLSGARKTVLTIQDMEKLPVSTNGGDEGPTLQSVLSLAGVSVTRQVKLVGMNMGRQASAELVLPVDRITDRVILDFTKQGTVKLSSQDIPRDQWVLDISRIEVD
jgi:hypothetical protein